MDYLTLQNLRANCFIRHCNFIQQEMPHKKEGVVRIGILQREGGGKGGGTNID